VGGGATLPNGVLPLRGLKGRGTTSKHAGRSAARPQIVGGVTVCGRSSLLEREIALLTTEEQKKKWIS